MFNSVNIWLVNLILVILILLIHTIIDLYLLKRIQNLETGTRFDDKILEALVRKTGLTSNDIYDIKETKNEK